MLEDHAEHGNGATYQTWDGFERCLLCGALVAYWAEDTQEWVEV